MTVKKIDTGKIGLLSTSVLFFLGTFLGLLPQPSAAVVIYNTTITTGAVANANVGVFENCRADQGCLGNAGLVDSNNDGAINASDVDTLNQQSFTFALTPAQKAALLGAASGTGTFSVTAARDIGHKVGASDVEANLFPNIEGTALSTLFQTTIDTCPAGERGVAYAADLVCGPNFHTDVTATDSAAITLALLKAAVATDSTIDFTLDPSAGMGRLKIFSAQLVIDAVAGVSAVPEPSTLVLVFFSLATLVGARRRLGV
jgi:PEP-CTERM motif